MNNFNILMADKCKELSLPPIEQSKSFGDEVVVIVSRESGTMNVFSGSLSIRISNFGILIGRRTRVLNRVNIVLPRDYNNHSAKIELICDSSHFTSELLVSLSVASRYHKNVFFSRNNISSLLPNVCAMIRLSR